MNLHCFFLAEDPVAELLHAATPKPNAMTPKEILILVAALAAATAFAVVIVFYFYSRTKTGKRRRRRHRSSGEASESAQSSGQGSGRRRRRSGRPMNTTLAQAGGLPPKREPGMPPPPMP